MTPHSSIERDQRDWGRNMAREDGSINEDKLAHVIKLRKPLKVKAKPQGHEAFLKALETSGTDIEIEKKSTGEKIRGAVKHSDKYTITLRYVDGSNPEPQVINRVIFKHDISEFRALQGKPAEEGVTLQ